MEKGCGVLFKSNAGNILTCGEKREDGNCFLCKWCLEKFKDKTQPKKPYRKIVKTKNGGSIRRRKNRTSGGVLR